MSRGRVCSIVPGYLCSAPRTVKEADALAEAGFDVSVVCARGPLAWARGFDEQLDAAKRWRVSAVDWGRETPKANALWTRSGIRQRAASALPSWLGTLPALSPRAEGRVFPELRDAAVAEAADLYIGHYPAGLAAAAGAARVNGSIYGYDAEDLHTAEEPSGTRPEVKRARIAAIERRHWGGARHRTAASAGISEALAHLYGGEAPVVLHNVFPLADRNGIDGLREDRRSGRPSLFWFSQFVGQGRGIEDAIRALGRMRVPADLHLRGSLYPPNDALFRTVAAEAGVADRVFFHPQVPPGELLSRAAEHDVGLALEQPVSVSRRLTVTNKLFLYFLAGLAVVATDVPGQRAVLEVEPAAGALCACGDVDSLARALDGLLGDPGRLASAKKASAEAASRWCWELESRKLVASVERALAAT